ncbi:hypothetical protein [Methylotuvimicrobium sp.]|uniref:restriction endonuclease n=1 Tax=Methylotuvimicrobium sp. TaxID=2822413 RepID=UPI003D65955D
MVNAKLPKGFFMSTPVGDYNPNWMIAHSKIECARMFFERLNHIVFAHQISVFYPLIQGKRIKTL